MHQPQHFLSTNMSYAKLMLAHIVATKENQGEEVANDLRKSFSDKRADELYAFYLESCRLYHEEEEEEEEEIICK